MVDSSYIQHERVDDEDSFLVVGSVALVAEMMRGIIVVVDLLRKTTRGFGLVRLP